MNFTKPLKNTSNLVKHPKKHKIDVLGDIEFSTNQRPGDPEFFNYQTPCTTNFVHPNFRCNFGRRKRWEKKILKKKILEGGEGLFSEWQL